MTVTREELVKIRIKLAKQMNNYIINLGDEDIWWDWIQLGIPDAPQEDDFEFFAENDDDWIELCSLFEQLTRKERGEQ